MTNRNTPHNDDGLTIKSQQKGRPTKPRLTQAEWAMIEGKGHRVAASIVSQARGSTFGSISSMEATRRRVSHEWIAKQRQKKEASENHPFALSGQPSQNLATASHMGPRMGWAETTGEKAGVQPSEVRPSVGNGEVANRPGGA